ncbi:hypothetical protein F5Y06DRAFT_33932 [Hypoxylon sp. FL0890]|nr:hypothetical protein F5Y06DRAFT_33932 [Hypoxylon sp. FL0890]
MGGLAFSIGANRLCTPRMSPTVYQHVLRHCRAKLQELFVIVATPIPGPGKRDYGDIDMLMAWERSAISPSPLVNTLLTSLSSSTRNPLEASARLLNAERYIKKEPKLLIAAIPWPEDLPEEAKAEDAQNQEEVEEPRFVQVDLHLCDSLEHLQWMLFRQAHGDLWMLLGCMIRPYGLTVDQTGLYIRVPEIEGASKKQCKVLLSSEPTKILNFLGLKYESTQWEQPFSSVEDLFEYAASCRLFWVRPKKKQDTSTAEGDESDETAPDRRRMKKRPVCRRWLDEFIPACREAGRFAWQPLTRDSVRKEAFKFFPGTQLAYRARIIEWKKKCQEKMFSKQVIKPSIPKPLPSEEKTLGNVHWYGNLAKALNKIIMQNDYSLGIRPPYSLRRKNGLYDKVRVRKFVQESWWEIGTAAWKAHQKHYAKYQAAKRKAAGGENSDEATAQEERTDDSEK